MGKSKLWDRLDGLVRVEIYAAFPESVLNECARRALHLRGAERIDECTLRLRVAERELEALREIAQRQQAELRELGRIGGSGARRRMKRRLALPLSLLAVGALLLWSNTRVWQIELRGCKRLSPASVRRALEECGLTEGCYWPALSQDTIRDQMLLRLPELAWMTVNVSGSRAVATLVERTEKPEIARELGSADIRASHAGIVRSMRVYEGRPLVQTGSAVLEGETLVTGSLDSLSRGERQVRASAEVLADTWYEATAVCAPGTEKGGVERIYRRFALRFGKKRINLSLRSRKELDGYDKIVHEYRVGIPGLFALPLSLIRETWTVSAGSPLEAGDARDCADRLREELTGQIRGELLQFRSSAAQKDGLTLVTVRAHCLENIAETAETDPP